MATIKQLAAEARTRVGKGAARAERRNKRVPAVIYGAGQPPVAISLDYSQVNQLIYAGHFKTTIFEINVDGKKEKAIPRDYQLDPVRDFPIHVDFLRLGEGSTVRVEVPVHFLNQEAAPGIKAGGTLEVVKHALELVCPAESIPESIDVDLTGLQVGDVVHISSIKLPAGVKSTSHEQDLTIALIVAPLVEKEAEPAAAAEAPASA